ncbi:Remorin, C-terminal [Parasponia andersonii]|uniref:Remorin, C-terminal n=1 Tax=Parasponia andersonii TaxID=3476 RepID=A0A2P5D6G5_PARAD|nr:Remorin, C-terminal [Parasponia andersonii]
MDNLVLKQRRVSFSGPGSEKQAEPEGIGETELQRRLERQYFSSNMSQDYDARDSEFATAVAAAAFAVHSINQVELQYQKRKKESLEVSRIGSNKSRKASRKGSVGLEHKVSKKASPAKQLSHTTSVRQAAPADIYQMPKGMSPRNNGVERKADTWEVAQMKRVQDRYEKTKSAITSWENEKKMQAKLKMEKRKKLLEQKRGHNMQHYQNKLARIEQIAGGARAQLEDKRKNEELAVKDKAKMIRSRGKVPARCFCFTC